MSKEMKLLESMKDSLTPDGEIFEHTKGYKDIYKALLKLDSIDNSNPSEALECLDKLDDIFYLVKKRKTPGGTSEEYEYHPSYTEEYDIIENYILKAQEQEKLLNIIESEFKFELYAMCKRRLELCTRANRESLEKIIEWLKREE